MKLKAVLPLIAVLTLAGCATPPLNTASGRPEVTVSDRSIAQVRTTAVNDLVDRGWTPVKTEGSQLMFEREGSTAQSFLMGMMTNEPQSRVQLTVTLVENDKDVRMIGGAALIGQNAFGRQTVVELHGKGYQQLQQALEEIKDKAEARERTNAHTARTQ